MPEFCVFTILYFLSFLLSSKGMYIFSGFLMITAGFFMFLMHAKKEKDPFAPAALFSLSWIGGLGLSCFKLSALQVDWERETWLCFYLIYAGFLLGGELLSFKHNRLHPEPWKERTVSAIDYVTNKDSTLNFDCIAKYDQALVPNKAKCQNYPFEKGKPRFLSSIITYSLAASQLKAVLIVLSVVSLLSFLIEAYLLGFIPLFTEDTPHAYSTFHISGLHYFTVLCVLVPPFFVAFNELNRRKADAICSLCLVISLMLPVFMVSRFQLIFSLMLAAFVFLFMMQWNVSPQSIGAKTTGSSGLSELLKRMLCPRVLLLLFLSLCLFMLAYLFITVERAHSVEYLNGIFEMKQTETPIFITQPYIYITNNFDNFNALIRDLKEHSHGLKMLYPVFALTGLKFIYPELVNFPIYTTKEELTTVTLFYDCWYDFGTVGCFLFALILGVIYAFLYRQLRKECNAMYIIVYAQLISYVCLAFFTTWFSNPATWFYLGVTIVADLILWYTSVRRNEKQKSKKNI